METYTLQESPSSYPVLIVPGYGSPSFQSEMVGKRLRSTGLDTVSVRLPWLAMGDMARSADVLAEQVRRLRQYRGIEKVNLLGYSLGGLVARYYLKELEGYPFLSRGAFIATPHKGTYVGYVGFFSAAGRQVRPGSPFLEDLNSPGDFDDIAQRCLSIFVRWDGVVLPCVSAYLPNAYNLMLRKPVSHWLAVMSHPVISRASEFLSGELPEGAERGRELGMLEAGETTAVRLELPAGKRYWIAFSSPFRSLSRWLKKVIRR